MKLLKKLLISILISSSLLIAMPTIIIKLPSSYTVQASTAKINYTKKTLYVGDKCTLKIKNTRKKVKWTSSNKSVATVNSKGKVTAKKKGTTTITAKIGNKKYKCKITVKQHKSITVYITRTGSKYHRTSCSYLRQSKIPIALKSAKSLGYTPCSRCKP